MKITAIYDNGGKTGQTRQGVQQLVAEDPGATWNQSTRQVEGSSGRVIMIGIAPEDARATVLQSVATISEDDLDLPVGVQIRQRDISGLQ